MGAGNDYALGDVGGEATHTLTIPELPRVHTLVDINFVEHQNLSSTGYLKFNHGGKSGSLSSGNVMDYGKLELDFGSGNAHNNLPPYQAVFMWQRTA